jgi:S1-C subfamily serine protease
MSTTCIFVLCAITGAQNVSELKPGVVRILNTRTTEVGAGFIIKVDGSEAYIITAAHVVKGDQHPRVYLFNRQHTALSSDVLDSEYTDLTKGLELLYLKLPSTSAAGISALKLGYSSSLMASDHIVPYRV